MWKKNLDVSSTIFALTTGTLPSAVAIVKLSGPDAFAIAAQLFFPSDNAFGARRGMWLGELRSPAGEHLDDILTLGFKAPHSHTGEDVVELHCHGSRSIISRLSHCLLELGARPAERGEFSYRAHLNGKTSAEELDTLGDVFLAREGGDLSRVYARKDGALATKIESLRQQILRVQAILDTAVDFTEEYSSVVMSALEPINAVIRECSVITHRYSSFKSGSNAPRMALVGRPNAGKSSLFNLLLCRYRAIVHAEPGTTRDVIEEDIEIDGRLWKLVDTAGVRPGTAGAEAQGIELGEEFLASSGFWILVVDGTDGLTPVETHLLERYHTKPHVIAWNKKDLSSWGAPPDTLGAVGVSAQTAEGLDQLKASLRTALPPETDLLPSSVQNARLERVLEKLGNLRTQLENGAPPEILAEEGRGILSSLELVVGTITTEDVLDRLFADFCIGK